MYMRHSIQMLFSILGLLICGVATAFAPAAASAQGIATGSMSATAVDASGGVIPDADVTAKSKATNQEFVAKTNGSGYVELRSLPPGAYKVTVSSKSFRTLVVDNVEIVVAQNTDLGGLKLEVGAVGEIIEVEGAAPLIETNTSQVTTTFSSLETSELPLAGGFDALALFIPGVADTGSNSFSNNNGASFSSNGLRGRSNNFQIDGQSNNDNSVAGPSIFLSNPDVLAELQAVTNNFSAEYGRNSGSVVNYITKSGTNAFHGTAYDYNIGNWSFSHLNGEKNPVQGFCPAGVAPGTTTAFATSCNDHVIPRYVENRWGGTFGGPIVKDKAFFFGSYQN